MRPKQYAERGQALILVALAAVGLFAVAGLAIDGSAKFSDRRHAQNAADTAVLAGALARVNAQKAAEADPLITEDAIELAMKYAARVRAADNGYDGFVNDQVWVYSCDDIDLTSPGDCGIYNGDPAYIEVVIESRVSTYFARVIGIQETKNTVHAIAVGGKLSSSGLSYDPNVFRAVWAGATSGCSPYDYFSWPGNDYTVTGGIHSNQHLNYPGNDSETTGISSVAGINTQTGNSTFDPPLQENTGAIYSDPFASAYTFSRFYTGGTIYTAAAAVNRIVVTTGKIDKTFLTGACMMDGVKCYDEGTKTLQDGIYVTTNTSDSSFDITDSNIHGDGGTTDFANITVATMGGIKLSGNGNKFKPYIGNTAAADSTAYLQSLHGLLFATWWDRGGVDQCSKYAISTNGLGHQFHGFFYAPNGQVELNGNTETVLGCIIANTAKLNGQSSSITCDNTWFPSTGPYNVGIMQ